MLTIPYNPIALLDIPAAFGDVADDHRYESTYDYDPSIVVGYGCGAISALEIAYRRPTIKGVVMINPTVNHWCIEWARPDVCDILVLSGDADIVAPQDDVFRTICGHGSLGFLDRRETKRKRYHRKQDGSSEHIGDRTLTAVNIMGMDHSCIGYADRIKKEVEEWLTKRR